MLESNFFLQTTPDSVDVFTLADQLRPFLLRLHSSLQVEEQDSVGWLLAQKLSQLENLRHSQPSLNCRNNWPGVGDE